MTREVPIKPHCDPSHPPPWLKEKDRGFQAVLRAARHRHLQMALAKSLAVSAEVGAVHTCFSGSAARHVANRNMCTRVPGDCARQMFTAALSMMT